MDDRQLEYFLTVARVGHFTRAASELHVGQPALSQAIRRLERELGVELFVRGSHPVALTSAGGTLLPFAEACVEAMEAAKMEFGLKDGEPHGRLTLGVLSSLGHVETVITSFHEAHPAVDIILREEVTSVVLEQLCNGNLDAAVATVVEPLPPEVAYQEAFSERLVAMGAPGWWQGGELHLSDFAGRDMLLPREGNGVRVIVERALRDAGVQPQVAIETSDIQRQRALSAQSVGVGIVPERVADMRGPDVDIVPLAEDLRRSVALMWRRDLRQSSTVRAFLQHARAQLASRSLPARG